MISSFVNLGVCSCAADIFISVASLVESVEVITTMIGVIININANNIPNIYDLCMMSLPSCWKSFTYIYLYSPKIVKLNQKWRNKANDCFISPFLDFSLVEKWQYDLLQQNHHIHIILKILHLN